MTMILKHIKFTQEDLQAVEQVQRLYGCESFSHAVRLAARIVAHQKRIEFSPPPPPKHAANRQPQSLFGIVQLSENATNAMDDAISRVAKQADQEAQAEWQALSALE